MSRLFTFSVHQRLATLRVDASELLSLAERLHSCARVTSEACEPSDAADLVWKEDPVCGQEFSIDLFGQPWEAGLGADAVFFQSENLVTQIFSERHSDKLQIHAGAVVSPAGKGWLIAGDSGAGKTSLTLALLLEGWAWLSDEMVLIEEAAPDELVGVPRNFNIKEVSFVHFPETATRPEGLEIWSPKRGGLVRFIDPEALAPKQFAAKAPLGAILFPKFAPELFQPALRACEGAELSGKLISSVFQSPAWAIRWVIETAGKIPAWEFRYTDPRAAARFLRNSAIADGALLP